MQSRFKKEFDTRMNSFNIWARRIYVVVFNGYAWYWLYRQIFIRHSYDFEEWLLYLLTVIGMHYFVLDSKGLFFNTKKQDSNK